MLLSIKSLSNKNVEATDGHIGEVHTYLFDDRSWIVRYLVIDTGKWLPGKKVLVTPSALGKPDGVKNVFPIELTKDQIRHSPDIDTEKPVSRQQEIRLHKYYNWVPYWGGPLGPVPMLPENGLADAGRQPESEQAGGTEDGKKDDPHLRSTREVIGYKIHAEDGHIGHVDDLIVDEEDWVIRYIVVDPKDWLPSRKVITSTNWIKEINWADSEVTVNATKEAIQKSPEYDPALPVNREYEIRLYDYYGRPKYWE